MMLRKTFLHLLPFLLHLIPSVSAEAVRVVKTYTRESIAGDRESAEYWVTFMLSGPCRLARVTSTRVGAGDTKFHVDIRLFIGANDDSPALNLDGTAPLLYNLILPRLFDPDVFTRACDRRTLKVKYPLRESKMARDLMRSRTALRYYDAVSEVLERFNDVEWEREGRDPVEAGESPKGTTVEIKGVLKAKEVTVETHGKAVKGETKEVHQSASGKPKAGTEEKGTLSGEDDHQPKRKKMRTNY